MASPINRSIDNRSNLGILTTSPCISHLDILLSLRRIDLSLHRIDLRLRCIVRSPLHIDLQLSPIVDGLLLVRIDVSLL